MLAAPITAEGLASDVFRGVPTISVGDPMTGDFGCPAVIADQQSGGLQATEHMLSLGHLTVWHVAGPVSWYAANARIEGWREALHRAGAPVHGPLAGDWTARAGYQAGLELAERPDVTAVFAANDQMATGLMRAFKEKGRQIPEDVSIVGFDDAPDSEYLMVPLTTVRQDFTAITHRAVTELVHAIAGEEINRAVTRIPVDLVIRASSGPARHRPAWARYPAHRSAVRGRCQNSIQHHTDKEVGIEMHRLTTRQSRALAVTATAGALILAGCADDQDEGGTDAPESDQITQEDIDAAMATETNLTFWTWVPDIQNQVDLFEAEYPAIDVEVVNVGQGAPHYQKLRTALESGTGAPDVVQNRVPAPAVLPAR